MSNINNKRFIMNKFTNSYKYNTIRKYRRNNKYNRNKNIPVISSKPITLGAGTSNVNITENIEDDQFLTVRNFLFNTLFNKTEFTIKRQSFMYFKINYIKIIIFAGFDPGSGDNNVNYLLVNWVNDNDITEAQIKNSDNTKIFGVFLPRNKVYTFIPPNVTVGGYNLSSFMSTQVTPYIGTLHYYLVKKKIFRIEMNVSFRGARDINVSSLIQQLSLNNKEDKKTKSKSKNKQPIKEEPDEDSN